MIQDTRPFQTGWQPKLIGCALTLSLASTGIADEYQKGLAAYDQDRYEQAIQYFRRSAKQGNTRAQYLLGTMYRAGIGIESNEYKGFEWCARAAKGGHLEAQFQLGLMYLEGEGVTQNDEKAMEWIWNAAERGYPQATEVLQYIMENDFGTGC